MNSYQKDLEQFEELLAYRNERELTEWEAEQFCRLIEKYPHFIERLGKDSQVEAMLQSLRENEYREMGFQLPAKNVIQLPPLSKHIQEKEASRSYFWKSAMAVCAAVVLALLYYIEPKQTPENAINKVTNSLAVVETKTELQRPLTAQEIYEQQIAKIPEVGSMKRPPTKFSNANNQGHEIVSYGEIRPILSEYCFHCHGLDEHSREAKLRLDTADGMLKKDAVVPGKPELSEVISRIYTEDPDEIMPPPKSHKTMKPEEKEKIRKWIEQGANWESHWAYELPRKTKPDKASLAGWNKNPIDQFVFAKMKEKGLKPSPRADAYTLARRVAFDLTGLPLSPDQIRKYVEKDFDKNYEKLVNDLIKTEAYGEHRAHYWLDAARYGDTHGLHNDKYREMYLYRDWVIDAFNQNKPFDEFTIEQFAGDLLPGSTVDQQIATGFHRCNVTSNEGGAINEELLVRYNVDRVSTTGTVFMGLTVGCAQCHDHKFDPISQKEFYQLFAFFNNTSQNGRDGGIRNTKPSIVVERGPRLKQYRDLESKYEDVSRQMKTVEKAPLPEKWDLDLSKLESNKNVSFAIEKPQSQGNNHVGYIVDQDQTIQPLPKGITWHNDKKSQQVLNFNRKQGLEIEHEFKIEADQAFSVAFWIYPARKQKEATLIKQYDPEVSKNGWRIQLKDGFRPTFQMLSSNSKHNNLYVYSNTSLDKNKWSHVCVKYSGGRHQNSIQILINGELVELNKNKAYESLEGDIETAAPLVIGEGFQSTRVHDLKIYDIDLPISDVMIAAKLDQVKRNLKRPKDKLKSSELDWMKRIYALQKNPEYSKTLELYYDIKLEKDRIHKSFPTALVMDEKSKPAMAHILQRGEYDKKGDQVSAAVPAFLGAWKEDYPYNRLGLAKWLVSKENPLTARVTVNRLWQQFFGHGLVRSADDFGAMGSRPTHPELLDWLAIEFMESGWDVQHMIRLIVHSETYQQGSQFKAQHHELDPENHLLARGPRFRLRAEALRDQALAVSGLLVHQTGGKSVKPYQPEGLWSALFNAKFVQDKGDDLYRRSVYTFWKRTVAPPSMVIFNAPSRETCIVKRENTNTPMQALTLMNDEQFVEAARVLAERTMKEEKTENAMIRSMGFKVLGYPMTEREQAKLSQAYREYRDYYKNHLDEAKAFISIGEYPQDTSLDPIDLSAWTMLASTLMNRDDVINKN